MLTRNVGNELWNDDRFSKQVLIFNPMTPPSPPPKKGFVDLFYYFYYSHTYTNIHTHRHTNKRMLKFKDINVKR